MNQDQTDELPPYIVPPCPREPTIVYADDDLLLVNKPEFLLTIPGRHPLNQDCLISRIKKEYPTATVVHRLDLDTSGILIIPLTRKVHAHISRQFQERMVEKSYQAIVFGQPDECSGSIDLPIAPDWENRPRQVISKTRGKRALTEYDILDTFSSDKTRVLLKPHTGRTHQLRIHLASIGHPIIGCDMYAHEAALAMSDRLMLHAHKIVLKHPVTGKRLEGEAPLPF